MMINTILKIAAGLTFVVLSLLPGIAQENIHATSERYQYPDDSLVRKKLEEWRDLKFGIIIHWGLYAVPGIIESWELCSEDWINRDSTIRYEDYKKWYWGLREQFNPINFNPDQWAGAAQSAGMRYVVFTTKHHDGFCMFNTEQTDFKITNGPFGKNAKADVALHVFEAFRKRNFTIGAYFSKPDWHSEFYWWPRYATPDRNNNYDIRKNPWRWEQFTSFTQNQIREITTRYGRIDILWLDGGWVRPLETVTEEVKRWGAAIPEWSQDIDMPAIADQARRTQPGILIVDRTVHGTYENYRTPEQSIPAEKSDDPWESCITLGNAWGHVPGDQFKSSEEVIHKLVEVVAKGGNLLLGIGPSPEGTFGELQILRLREIGDWLRINGEAIYNTRTTDRYRDGNTWFTKGKDGTLFAIVLMPEGGEIPQAVSWIGNLPAGSSSMKLLSVDRRVKFRTSGSRTEIQLPESIRKKLRGQPALAFAFTPL